MFEPKVALTRLEKSVLAYEAQPIEKGRIMFYGSSGFTRWGTKWNHRPLEEDILCKDGSPAAVNHGFGSSTAEELLYYYPRLVKPWAPRALVVSIIHNDHGFGYTPEEIVTNLSKLFAYARTDFPGIRLYVCDARHTLKWRTPEYFAYCAAFRRLLEEYCERHEDTTLICHADDPIWYQTPEDVGDRQKVREDIFVEDQVHFNQKGYDLYRTFMLRQLDDIL